jgi:RNA polymerase subunit RPABC4/transcription elongation factor Spt4
MVNADALHACDNCGNVFNALISMTCPVCDTHWTERTSGEEVDA